MKQIVLLLMCIITLEAAKIEDIANVVGVRENQLIGYGLVVGLHGTGDGSSLQFTKQAISSMLQSVNVKVDPRGIKSKNVAAVMVTAKLPPFSRHGDKIDIEVSSMGDAKSIIGGTLLLTPLRAVDGNIYALAQGTIQKGYSSGKKRSKGATTAKIFGGAIIENEVDFDLYHKKSIRLSLKTSNFETALKIQNRLNSLYGKQTAIALDPRTIEIYKPSHMSMVEFLARVNKTEINYQGSQKIVIDEKSGTIVSGIDIKVEPVLVTHGDLTLKIVGTSTLPDNRSGDIYIDTKNNIINIKSGKVTVANIARVLQKLGSKPSDIIEMLQTIKRAGAINAELEVI